MLPYIKQDCLVFIFLTNWLFIYADNITVKFMVDFFREKNVMLTVNVCWRYDDLKCLLMNLSQDKNKNLVAIYNNSTDMEEFFNYLAADNYFVIDFHSCEHSWNILKKANQSNFFRYPLKWLMIIPETDYNNIQNVIKNFPIFPTSHVIIAKRETNNFQLLLPYRTDATSRTIWEKYGYWSNISGLQELLLYTSSARRRKDLQVININVSVVIKNEDTWNHLEDLRYLNVDMFVKQNWIAIKSLLEYCNINYHLLKTDDFGYLNKTTGRWSGIIGDLLYGRSQIPGSLPLLTRDRSKAVEFLVMMNPSQIRFVLRKPPLSYISNIFVLPFYWTVWAAIAIVLCLFGIVLFIILNWETKHRKKINFQDKFAINDVLLIAFETLCQQGTMTEPKSISGRTISLIFLTGFMFLYVAYSANIVALLQSTVEITSLKQLFGSRMEVGAQNVYYMKNYLTGAKDKVRQELYKKKIGPEGFYSLEEGAEKIRQGFFALHMELGAGYYHILKKFTDYEVCSLQELEGYAKSPGGYACVPKNSPYKEIFKVGLLRIEEHGIRRRNYYRVFKKPKCYSQGASFDSVGIMDTYPAILFWIYGIILALLIFQMEKIVQKMKRRNRTSIS